MPFLRSRFHAAELACRGQYHVYVSQHCRMRSSPSLLLGNGRATGTIWEIAALVLTNKCLAVTLNYEQSDTQEFRLRVFA